MNWNTSAKKRVSSKNKKNTIARNNAWTKVVASSSSPPPSLEPIHNSSSISSSSSSISSSSSSSSYTTASNTQKRKISNDIIYLGQDNKTKGNSNDNNNKKTKKIITANTTAITTADDIPIDYLSLLELTPDKRKANQQVLQSSDDESKSNNFNNFNGVIFINNNRLCGSDGKEVRPPTDAFDQYTGVSLDMNEICDEYDCTITGNIATSLIGTTATDTGAATTAMLNKTIMSLLLDYNSTNWLQNLWSVVDYLDDELQQDIVEFLEQLYDECQVIKPTPVLRFFIQLIDKMTSLSSFTMSLIDQIIIFLTKVEKVVLVIDSNIIARQTEDYIKLIHNDDDDTQLIHSTSTSSATTPIIVNTGITRCVDLDQYKNTWNLFNCIDDASSSSSITAGVQPTMTSVAYSSNNYGNSSSSSVDYQEDQDMLVRYSDFL